MLRTNQKKEMVNETKDFARGWLKKYEMNADPNYTKICYEEPKAISKKDSKPKPQYFR